MAHGFGGTKDSGLLPFAEAMAEAGLDVLLFDYRGFGESSGEPRQFAWPPRHREDYGAAIDYARGLDGVDLERIVLWGTSWSGGHVVYAAAADPAIAAVISQSPDLDGIATLRQIGRYAGLGHQLEAHLGRYPGRGADAARPGAADDRNRGTPGRDGRDDQRGLRAGHAGDRRPDLAERGHWTCRLRRVDRIAPSVRWTSFAARSSCRSPTGTRSPRPTRARAAAWRAKGRVEMRDYPCAHFDVYVGEWRERVIADQLHFLRRHLAATETRVSAELTSNQ